MVLGFRFVISYFMFQDFLLMCQSLAIKNSYKWTNWMEPLKQHGVLL